MKIGMIGKSDKVTYRFYIDRDGSDEKGDGSLIMPYYTIAGGLNNFKGDRANDIEVIVKTIGSDNRFNAPMGDTVMTMDVTPWTIETPIGKKIFMSGILKIVGSDSYKGPEIPSRLYCMCSSPKIKTVHMVKESYEYCCNCKKERT